MLTSQIAVCNAEQETASKSKEGEDQHPRLPCGLHTITAVRACLISHSGTHTHTHMMKDKIQSVSLCVS